MSNPFSDMGRFANQDDDSPIYADEIYRLAMSHFCSVGGVTAEDISKKQAEQPYKGLYEYYVTHNIRFSKKLQDWINPDPEFKKWLISIGLDVFLDNPVV